MHDAVLRAEAVLLLQPLRVGPDGRAARRAATARAGSIDAYAAAVGRWLVTRDGFDFLAYYLSDFDFASHAHGPRRRRRTSRSSGPTRRSGALLDAAGGPDEFLERYAVILLSDHGQTPVEQAAQLEEPLRGSRRTGRRHRLEPRGAGLPAPRRARRRRRARAARSTASRRSRSTLRREGDEAVARRDGEELRFGPSATAARRAATRDPRPSRRAARSWSALANPNAGELLVSRRARAGSSPTSAAATTRAAAATARSSRATRIVPVLTVGVDAALARITDVAPAVLAHFGVAPPSMAALARVA